VIEATQKKLHEANFFLRLLNEASKEVIRSEPEAFECYLSAFLSAARSVTFALQCEEKDKYEEWSPIWFGNRSEDDQKLLRFLVKQRNSVQKRGLADISMDWEYIPVTEKGVDNRGYRTYEVHWVGPPGMLPPEIGLPVYSFDLSGDQQKVTSACNRYMEVLNDLVRDFIQAHSEV
jgi:hypothetical protein